MRIGRSSLMILLFLLPLYISAQRISREEYINQYKDLAMREMLRSGIPASITLAQGMLESDNGNSTLARKANNHFGIKCHNDWRGRKIYHDDDERNECFRRYKTVYDSYIDHSDFLKYKNRYASLFDLEITDYKGWARGLKKYGYATSRTYATMLIGIIEDNELHQYDLLALDDYDATEDVDLTDYASGKKERSILINNRIDYIIVRQGDSFESLNEELDLRRDELFRYNELTIDSSLRAGEILYLQPKRNRAEAGKELHILKADESLYEISQVYGVKLKALYKKNNLEPGEEVEPGTRINLRKRKKRELFTVEPEKTEEAPDFEFRFEQ